MTQPETQTYNCILDAILGFMLPFFLAAAAGNPEHAKAAIKQLIAAYNPSTPTQLDLVGRIIGFSIASMDNLRLSMTPGLSDAKVLRYRSNAATLSRASNQALKMLEASQANQQPTQPAPRPTVAAAPPPPKSQSPAPSRPVHAIPEHPPQDIEAMKREARIMMMAFSKNGAPNNSAAHMPAAMPVNAARPPTRTEVPH
jgi:hypothetical protein